MSSATERICGAVKTSICGAVPRVCNLDPGHPGDHGVRIGQLPPHERWAR